MVVCYSFITSAIPPLVPMELRSTKATDGLVTSNIVIAKSRQAPVKTYIF